jgi:oligopeptidase A
MTQQANPLLADAVLPQFDKIQPEHVEPAVRTVCEEMARALDVLEASVQPTWQELAVPIERLQDRLGRVWGTVGHLMGVANSPELRAAHDAVQALVIEVSMRAGQSRPLYDAWKALEEGPEWPNLTPAQQRIVTCNLRDAELSGVGLDGEVRERFNAIQLRLAELATQFSNHVLDATKAWSLDLAAQEDIAGLPPSLLGLAAQTWRDAHPDAPDAKNPVEDGPWRITLDMPLAGPFLQHSQRRDDRERVYRASVTRASQPPHDNTPLLDEILSARLELAQLLGYADYAELSLVQKMAATPETALQLLESLRGQSLAAAEQDLADLRKMAAESGKDEARDFQPWDVAFWAERLREAKYAFNDEQLRPYFALPTVLDGLFALANRLFGVTIRAADGETAVWHPDVRFFRVCHEDGHDIAAFYLDPYSRPAHKRGGAWMDECVGRSEALAQPGEAVRLPVAYLVCNQTPPVGSEPSLMTFGEVETLFHEFGHGLQHMLTEVAEGMVSGIRNIEWDAVELPSQFMENWCYHEPTLRGLTRHIETGEPLPLELFQRLLAARTFRAGSDMLRQLLFALTDLALHHGYRPGLGESPFDVYREVASRTSVLQPLPEDRFLCAFSHIFAGGYAAGYFSYKWAEVLSADAYAAFEEAGLDDPTQVAQTGRHFRDTVLGLGGSQHPAEVFRAFRGRDASTEALLRHYGLLEAA